MNKRVILDRVGPRASYSCDRNT